MFNRKVFHKRREEDFQFLTSIHKDYFQNLSQGLRSVSNPERLFLAPRRKFMSLDTAGKIASPVESPEILILRRVADGDKNAFRECVEKHGGMIWSMAKSYSDCEAEAEMLTQEIFREIWKGASGFERADCTERIFIRLIAFRHLLNQFKVKN